MSMDANEGFELVGLTSFVYNISSDGPYHCEWFVQLPNFSQTGSVSQAVMTITQAGSAANIYVGNPGDNGGQFDVDCLTGDTLTFQLSSGASVDQGLNNLKAEIAISQGVM